jgi:hypothetical protein
MFFAVFESDKEANFAINIDGTWTVRSPDDEYNEELGFVARLGMAGTDDVGLLPGSGLELRSTEGTDTAAKS